MLNQLSHPDVPMFVYFWETEKEGAHKRGGGAEREGQRIPSRLHSVSTELNMGLNPTNHETTTSA